MNDTLRTAFDRTRRLLADPLVARIGGRAISVAVLGGALFELHMMDWHAIAAMVPHAPIFWSVFAVMYMTPVVADWSIYSRIWRMPVSGMQHLLRKTIGNELVFGYIGEAYLYTWARRSGEVGADAFRAVRDVAILSSAVGSIVTLAAALAVVPVAGKLHLAIPYWAILPSIAVILAPPIFALAFGKRLFSLPPAMLARIVTIHGIRAALTVLLTAVLWHIALPDIAVVYWLAFAALKLVLSRLPLISNRELVFAGTTAALLGRGSDVAQLMTMMAALVAATHVLAGIGLSIGDAIEGAARRTRGVLSPSAA
ncbi:hypothetical protein [Sphingomonas bacterium]|uniref:hypothetical protein n=1 Tax=Sphingomonas bacterium TaxID=1895847 RepID=UPI00157543D5|nr:hypothetical protein [Sphingomonas bacterium]